VLALKREEIISTKAKEKQKGGQGGILLCLKSDEAIVTNKELAKIAKVGHDTIWPEISRTDSSRYASVLGQVWMRDLKRQVMEERMRPNGKA